MIVNVALLYSCKLKLNVDHESRISQKEISHEYIAYFSDYYSSYFDYKCINRDLSVTMDNMISDESYVYDDKQREMQLDFLLNLFLNYPQLEDVSCLSNNEIGLNDQCIELIFNRLLNLFPYYIKERKIQNFKMTAKPISRDRLTNQLVENSNQMLKILVI